MPPMIRSTLDSGLRGSASKVSSSVWVVISDRMPRNAQQPKAKQSVMTPPLFFKKDIYAKWVNGQRHWCPTLVRNSTVWFSDVCLAWWWLKIQKKRRGINAYPTFITLLVFIPASRFDSYHTSPLPLVRHCVAMAKRHSIYWLHSGSLWGNCIAGICASSFL